MKKDNKTEVVILRRQAKELLKNKPPSPRSRLSEGENKKMILELEILQIELVLQNEELIREKETTELATKKYAELYDFAPSGYFTLSEESKIIELNLGGALMLGKERSSLKNSLFGFFVSNDTRPIFNHFLEKVFEGKIQQTCDVNISINGSLKMNAHLTGIVSKNGHECLVNVVDISKLKQEETKRVTVRQLAADELKKQKDEFDMIFNLVPAQIWFKDTHNNFIRVNRKACTDIGMTNDQIEGHSAEKLFPSFAQKYYLNDLEVINTRKPKLGIIEQVNNLKGEIRWLHCDKIPVFGNDGEVSGLIAFVQDITERKQATEELFVVNIELLFQNDEKEKRAEELIIANKELVFQNEEKEKRAAELIIANKELHFQNVEKEKRAAELIIANKELLFQNDEKEKRAAELIIANKELHFQNIEKEKRAAELIIANKELLFQNDEKEKRAAELIIANKELHFQNIEKEKRAEELIIANKELVFQNEEKEKRAAELIIAKVHAEESDRLKSAFLANMSHEVRTPLNSIIGFSELLADSYFEEEEKNEFIHHIIKSGKNLLFIISDIMDISKMESGEITLRKSQINVHKFISNIKEQFSYEAEAQKLELKLTVPDNDNETTVFADTDRLSQIFNNLMSNALKFTAYGRIEIGYEPKREMVEFYIRDTGIGIPAEYHEKIFDRFRQVESGSTRQYGGNGLGLAICKNLVGSMGGKIWLESEPRKGSAFYFTLPFSGNCNNAMI